jgi:hypothetical protein
MIRRSNLLEWLAFYHVRVVTEHFFVWLEKYFLQSLEATFVRKTMRTEEQRIRYPISFVERF